ncbi:MAG: argininosuccinate synthase [Conexivisphaerales archaeon]
MGKTVLAYSGGLDTTASIGWIKEKYGDDVITVTVNVGQQEDFKEIEERAYSAGSLKHYIIDAKEEFAKNFILKSIKANGLYEKKYPLATALARPLIAMKAVEVAKKEQASAIAHGSTGKGNDQVRFEITIKALYPQANVYTPVREWNMNREEELEYVKKKGIPIKVSKSEFSIDENLWGRSIESGRLEDPWTEPPEEAFAWTSSQKSAPDSPEYVEIEFENGVPVALNGRREDLVNLIKALNLIAGRHGVGRVDHLEDRVVGIKSREVYECPAASVLLAAHEDLEKMTLTKSILWFKDNVDQQWSTLIYEGLWADPLRNSLESFIESTQAAVTGIVRLKLFKGQLYIVGRKSPNSLYRKQLSTYSSLSTFDQKQAVGFINLWGLQTLVYREVNGW